MEELLTPADGQIPQLVVIGASAGGIDALGKLLATLPPDFPAPVVIAQHVDPTRASHLGDILSRQSRLAVQTLTGREPLKPGLVYVVPSNRDVAITDHDVTLREETSLAGPKPSVDLLLSSAATSFGEGLIAVILSGMGSDGAAGAYFVKQHGGTVIIQNPDTAGYPSMPQSLAPTTVDVVADLEHIGRVLTDLLSGSLVPARPDTQQMLELFLEELRARSGIDFTSYKRPTIQRRLTRRMAATSCPTLEAYIAYIQTHSEEYHRLVKSFLIKVTEFFRDGELYAYLRQKVLPELMALARKRGSELRIWSAGCATGEEPYSLAILVAEALDGQLDQFPVRIFATDVDNDAVSFARRGVYPASAVREVSPELLERHFTEHDGEFEIKKAIRSLTIFGQHDLGQRAPFPQIDLILCRNVLIYFAPELQKRALQLFAFAARDGGYLVLGKAETTTPLAELFTTEESQWKVYRRHGERLLIPPARTGESTLPGPQRPALGRRPRTGDNAREHPRPPSSIRTQAEKLQEMFLQLPVGLVVVNQQYDIQTINNAARRLLGIHSAAVDEDFIHLAQCLPSRALRTAIDTAVRERSAGNLEEIDIEELGSGQTRYLDVSCYPYTGAADGQDKLAVVVIGDVTDRVQHRRELEQALAAERAEREKAVRQAQRLAEVHAELLAANEQLTSMNMELRGANEEFLVDNEEVQAATEEVETLNEELQATNEELETLNEELQATVEELSTTNDDLQSRSEELQRVALERDAQRREVQLEKARLEVILESMGSALLVVDAQGQPVLANKAYNELFSVPLADLKAEDLDGGPLRQQDMPQQRAAHGESFHMEFVIDVDDGKRCWFEAVGTPLRAAGNGGSPASGGGVLVIRDVTDRSIRQLQDELMAQASHELRTPLTALSGFVQMALRSLPVDANDEMHRRQLEQALTQVHRLDLLINDLLDVTRLQTGKLTLRLQELDLTRLVASAVDAGRALATDRVITLMTPERPLPLRGDPGRLEQVIMNLLANAVTYTQPSDDITVRLTSSGDEAILQVEDTGPGIAAEDMPHLFSRYYRSSRGGGSMPGGLGLGLFIVRQFVAAHGGAVDVSSTVGAGTTFTVRLPLAAA